MMRVDAATRTEEVLRRSGMESIACQCILALQKFDATHFRHDNDGASHSAVRASAAQDRIEAVAERHLETHRAAMALASPNVPVTHHVVSPVQITNCRNCPPMRAMTLSQSPKAGCRNSRAVGYHGLSSRFRIQRKSAA